ncbi:site-specific integrase [Polaromonas sp. P2-4]|nr:site-specific integrase [Polaromonas sp. P2-4]
MLAPDDRHKQAFCIEYIDGAFRSECSPNAKAETILLMGDLMKVVMMQVVGRGRRAANDAVAPAAPHAAREDVFIPPPPSPSSVTSSIDADVPDNAQNEVKWLSDAIEEWALSDAVSFSAESWTYSYKPTFRVFRELVGDQRRDRTTANGTFMPATLDIPLQHLTREHIVAFHQGLKELPARQGQRDDGVEAPERIRKGKLVKLPPPSLESVCKKLLHIKPFLKHAHRKGWVQAEVLAEFDLAMEAADARLAKARKKQNKKPGAVALTADELKRMFEQQAFLAGALDTPWKFWIPLLCMYHGFRVSEASQIYTDDVILVDGVPCISLVNDEDDEDTEDDDEGNNPKSLLQKAKTLDEFRRLKNAASRRVIPIHPRLIERGFLDHVESMRQLSPRPVHLFQGLRWEAKSMFGRKPSEYMGQLLRIAGVWKFRQKVPHSLRSNYKQALDATGMEADLVKRMLGHSTGAVKDSNYNETDVGPALPMTVVVPHLARVSFPIQLPSHEDLQQMLLERAQARDARRHKS